MKSKQKLYLTEKCAFVNHVRFCLTCLSHSSIIPVWDVPGKPGSQISLRGSWMMATFIFHITGEFRMQLTFTLLFTCSWSSWGVHELLPTPLSAIFSFQFIRIKSKEWKWTDEYSDLITAWHDLSWGTLFGIYSWCLHSGVGWATNDNSPVLCFFLCKPGVLLVTVYILLEV